MKLRGHLRLTRQQFRTSCVFKNLRLVKSRREGTTIYYMQDDNHVLELLTQAIRHVHHH